MSLRIDERRELIGADRACAPETHDHRRGRSSAEIFGLRHVRRTSRMVAGVLRLGACGDAHDEHRRDAKGPPGHFRATISKITTSRMIMSVVVVMVTDEPPTSCSCAIRSVRRGLCRSSAAERRHSRFSLADVEPGLTGDLTHVLRCSRSRMAWRSASCRASIGGHQPIECPPPATHR